MPFADLSDLCCYYEVHGDGEVVVLVPGLGSTCRAWDALVDHLSGRFCLITPDNRGVGRSIERRPARSLRDYSADLIELLDHLQVDRAHVIGISMGGMIAQWVAMLHPDRVRRLVLLSTTHRLTPYLAELTQLIGQTVSRMPRRVFERMMQLLSLSALSLDADPTLLDRTVDQQMRRKAPAKQIARQLRCIVATVPTHQDYHIQAPTLVVAGEHDVMIPSSYGRQMAYAIPDSRFLLIEGAGHNLLTDLSPRLVAAIESFLTSGHTPGTEKGVHDEHAVVAG